MNTIISNILKETKLEFKGNKYANVTFKVYFNNNILEEKYKQRIYPFITEEDTENSDFNLCVMVDDELFKEMCEIAEMYPESNYVASYCSKESGMVRLKRYAIEDYLVVLSDKRNAFWILDKQKENIFFIGNKECLEHFYREFFLLFEHIIVKKCVEKGAMLVHAAAVEKDNRVVILVGNKRSGKTTTFFELCKEGKYAPMSLDKVLLIEKGGVIKVYGVPTRLRVLAGTLSKYEELYSLIPEKYQGASDDVLWKGESDSKVEMPLKQFEEFVDNNFSQEGKLSQIVFNHVNSDMEDSKVNVGKTNDNSEILENNIFSPVNPEEDWWSEIGLEKIDLLNERKNIMLEKIKKLNFIEFETKNDFTLLFEILIAQ